MWPSDASQWVDADGDGYGDNPAGTMGDACPGVTGASSVDRYGCPMHGDGYSDADSGWTVLDGADAFPSDASLGGHRWRRLRRHHRRRRPYAAGTSSLTGRMS